MLTWATDFADISSYLTFEISAWKKVCTISFELEKQTHSDKHNPSF